jgi:hypothetical protein
MAALLPGGGGDFRCWHPLHQSQSGLFGVEPRIVLRVAYSLYRFEGPWENFGKIQWWRNSRYMSSRQSLVNGKSMLLGLWGIAVVVAAALGGSSDHFAGLSFSSFWELRVSLRPASRSSTVKRHCTRERTHARTHTQVCCLAGMYFENL